MKLCSIATLCLFAVGTGCDVSTEHPAPSHIHRTHTEDSSVGTMQEGIVGTWKDLDSDNVDTYNNDSSVLSEMDELIVIELSEIGFGEGSISVHVRAKAQGRWSLEGDRLTVKYDSVDDVSVGEASLRSDSFAETFGSDFATEFVDDFPQQLKAELPSTICDQEICRAVVSLDKNVLVTRDESDGKVERQERVSP